MSAAPMMSLSRPGLMRTNAAVNKLMRSQTEVTLNKYPERPDARHMTPMTAVMLVCTISIPVPMSSRDGPKTNMNGMIYPVAPSRSAVMLESQIDAREIPFAAYTANATGGVMADRMAK